MADGQRWRTWGEIRTEAAAAGRIDEAEVAEHRERQRAAQRGYRLMELRRARGMTQADVAKAMHVSQRRVSAVEHGDVSRSQIGTLAAYVAAIGGQVKVVADFGDEQVTVG